MQESYSYFDENDRLVTKWSEDETETDTNKEEKE